MKVTSAISATTAAKPPVSATAKAADGDYKVRNANTSQVKDADGDYKLASAAAKSASGVQAALTSLKLGG